MEFPGEIVANIIEQRLSLCKSDIDEEYKNVSILQTNHILGFGLTIAVNFYLSHEKCKNRESDHSIPFEVWTIQRRKEKINGTGNPLLPLFLKQAIRSQLHFSPINSWLAQKGQKFPEGMTCSYRISTNPNLMNKIPNGIIETHSFPICKFEPSDPSLGEYLEVNVEWIRAKEMPTVDFIKKNDSAWLAPPTDGIQPSSTEEEEEDGSSSTPSSPSFPPSPPGEVISEENKLMQISTERELEMMKEFLVNSDGKKKRRKKSYKNDETDDDEEDKDKEKSKIRKSRRYKTTSTSNTSSNVEPILRSRNSRSFCGTSLNSDAVAFNPRTRLPLNSSPAPLKRTPLVQNLAAKLKNKLTLLDGDSSSSDSEYVAHQNSTIYGSQHSSNALLCNFEESALNGRLEPISTVEGFRLQLAVSGNFSVPHTMIPVSTYFFDVSDDNAPSLYLGHCSFKDAFGRKAVHIPKKCIVQATLFNPQGSVVRIFIVKVDCSDIPPRSRTFIRQRTFAAPEGTLLNDKRSNHSWLRYLINLRLATDRAGKLYMHTDIRLLFSNKTDLDIMNLVAEQGPSCSKVSNVKHGATYELITTTEMPQKPKYSPVK